MNYGTLLHKFALTVRFAAFTEGIYALQVMHYAQMAANALLHVKLVAKLVVVYRLPGRITGNTMRLTDNSVIVCRHGEHNYRQHDNYYRKPEERNRRYGLRYRNQQNKNRLYITDNEVLINHC